MTVDPQIEFTTNIDRDMARVTVAGELDLRTRHQFAAFLSQLGAQYASVHLDISQIEFIDAAGLHALEQVVRAGRSGRRLQLEPIVQPQVRRVLELTHTTSLLRAA
jgi:anti-anti-sigma factor